MDNQKIKVLFVITKLEQGGSERFLFEVCRALDKEKFQIEILTRKRIDDGDYYYSKLKGMGIRIHGKMPLRRYLLMRFFPDLIYRFPGYKNIMDAIHRIRSGIQLRRFFDPYDLISFIQIDNYFPLQHFFPDNQHVVIHLMSNVFQYHYDFYEECDCGKKYNLVLSDPAQKTELEKTNCSNAETPYFPLAMDFTGRESAFNLPKVGTPVKIGIVMRLTTHRPIEFLFYAFRDLLKDINATLHIYGQGDPIIFFRTLDLLHIRDKVFFEGQCKDLEKMIRSDNLSVVWLTSHASALGYASIEIASLGVPMVFWNLSAISYNDVLSQTEGGLHSFSTITEFVKFNEEILLQPHRLLEVGQKLRAYILSTYDIYKHIKELEDIYLRVAGKR